MSNRSLIAATLTVVGALATGCGSGGPVATASTAASERAASVAATPAPDGVQEVTLDANDMLRFAPARVTARTGRLRIVLTDPGSYPHNISFPALQRTSATVSGSPGRQSTSLTVSLTKPGTYRFVCTFHDSAGMTGEVLVTA